MKKLILFLIFIFLIKLTYADYTIYENFTFNPSQNNVTYRMNRTFEGMTVIEINETCLTLNTSIWCNSSATSKEINISEMLEDITPPIISNLRNTSTTNQSSYVEWSCNENCNYTLHLFNNSLRTNEYIFDIRYNNTFNLSHNPYWNNLTNSTVYFINLTVWDTSGNSAVNNTFNFTTASNIISAEAIVLAPSAGREGGTGLGTEISTAKISEVTLAKYGYPCPTDIPFFKRLFSRCIVANNGICDDGEWFLISKDCELGNILFFSMWFLRVIFTISILFLVRNNKFFPIIAVFLLILFYLNGAFPLLEKELTMPEAPELKSPCIEKSPFSIIFSNCKIPDNNICDYGEYPFINKECNLTTYRVLFGKIFTEMWLLRVLLVLSIIFLIARKNNYFAFCSIMLIILLATNSDIVNLLFNTEVSCEGVNYIYNFGGCIAPLYPLLGWMLGLIILLVTYFIVRGIISVIKKPKRKVKT